ncbi:uncharacterized protein EV422DRAFT_569306 [Fimicolochytrium jonesii]|uniref:uncharacterized protein n=1 Tax=Fimicolochytrium jonesii TaxID=1396493 RepID=UPI0022FE3D81|nr:uncharacterized protein EV422DRAFT_569306 [Fimicolochytrium jonesii]KAI8819032.1 hypothetical protein EV422DRAFT_569306 [Fimicolochytrium jonesii]
MASATLRAVQLARSSSSALGFLHPRCAARRNTHSTAAGQASMTAPFASQSADVFTTNTHGATTTILTNETILPTTISSTSTFTVDADLADHDAHEHHISSDSYLAFPPASGLTDSGERLVESVGGASVYVRLGH